LQTLEYGPWAKVAACMLFLVALVALIYSDTREQGD